MSQVTGSSYTNYTATHRTYDLTRLAVAGEQIVELLKQKSPLEQITLLDAGCGTGLHLKCFHAAGIGKLIGVDSSATGLEQCRQKLSDAANLELATGDIRLLPVMDGSVDVAFFSYVLHHLPSVTQQRQRAETRLAMREAWRVLRPGGQLIVLTCSREQLDAEEGSIWYYRYFPEAAASLSRRFMPDVKLRALLAGCGYQDVRKLAVEQTYYTQQSLNPLGPTDESWRNGDSLFAYYKTRPQLLSRRLRSLKSDIESGEVERHIASTVKLTETLKQGILILATKA
jgi:ubiquinone/menaquinone biosynthesis C-methylase UbiE